MHEVALATRLIKMAVLHAKAGVVIPTKVEYEANEKEETALKVLAFYRGTQARAFNSAYPATTPGDLNTQNL